MSAAQEFDLFWKFYGTSYAVPEVVEEAKQAFIIAIERQISLALQEEQCAFS